MAGANVETVAKAMNLTPRRVQQLVAEGMPKAKRGQYDLGACLVWYVRYLQKIVESRADHDGATGQAELTAERTRLAKSQADKTEIEVSVLRAELIPAAVVERVQGQMISNTRSRVLSLPVKAAPLLVNRKNETDIKTILTEMVHEVLAEMAEFSESDYVPERQQTLGATAEADAEPVGGRKAIPKSRGQRRAGPVEH